MNRRMISAMLMAASIVSCTKTDGALDCEGGSLLELSSTEVCAYRDPLLVETGFSCPAEAEFGSTYGDLVICSPQRELPEDFFEEAADRFADDVPTGDCADVLCDLGQACSEGSCEEWLEYDEQGARLELSPLMVDFGDIFSSDGLVTQTITVRNVGELPLELSELTASTPFIYDGEVATTVSPGDELALDVSVANEGPEKGEMIGTLTMSTNDPAKPEVTVTLMATLLAEVPLCGDMFEPNDSWEEATTVALDTEHNAVLCPADEDWWAFELTEVTDQTLTITSPTDLTGVKAELYQFDDGDLWHTSNDHEFQGLADSATPILLTPGMYAWRITAPSTPVAYALTVANATAMCPSDILESNDTMMDASRTIDDGEDSGYLFGTLCGADVDYYVLQDPNAIVPETLEVGRSIEVAITSIWGEAPPVTLHGPAGPVSVTSSTTSGEGWIWEQLVYEVDVEGVYHVEVNAPATDVYYYRFGASVRPSSACTTDLNEPNDAAGAATLLSPVSAVPLQVTDQHLCDGDEDWFAFDLADGQAVLLSLTHSNTASFRIELFKDGESVPRAVVVDDEAPEAMNELGYRVPAADAGRYLARVSNAVPGAAARDYVLDVLTD